MLEQRKDLVEVLQNEKRKYEKSITKKKRNACEPARKIRSEQKYNLVAEAIEKLKENGIKVTPYNIERNFEISFVTAKKYLEIIQKEKD